MRVRILIAAAVVTGGWLAACSKPAADQEASGSARQIRLAEPPSSDGAVVSDLEAHHVLKPTLVRRAGALAVRASLPTQVVDVPAAPPHMMSMTTSSMTMPGLAPVPAAPAPLAPALIVGRQASEAAVGGEYGPSFQPMGGTRGPMILIRGGMGGIDDKCDLRGGHRGGIAINRSAPSFGGYPRGGIR